MLSKMNAHKVTDQYISGGITRSIDIHSHMCVYVYVYIYMYLKSQTCMVQAESSLFAPSILSLRVELQA